MLSLPTAFATAAVALFWAFVPNILPGGLLRWHTIGRGCREDD